MTGLRVRPRRDRVQHALAARRREVIERIVGEAERAGTGCSCGIHPGMTSAELAGMEDGCTAPAYACPVLVSVRRRLGARG